MDPAALAVYGITILVCVFIVYRYVRKGQKKSEEIRHKVERAKEEGRFEPVSLHPYINLDACIGSGACIRACPEKDILGIIDGKATVINTSSCIGHGACFQACPVDAISLRIGTESRGVDLPHVKPDYETNVPGIYIAGELGGMGLIKNSAEQGIQAVESALERRKKSSPNEVELAIVGAGPAGITGSLMAKKHGMKAVVLEQDSLGGTVFTFPRSKVVMTRPVELPLYGKMKLVNTSKQELLEIWKDAISQNEIDVRENTAVKSIRPTENGFTLELNKGGAITADQVLVAIGRRGSPRKLGVPGEMSTKVAYRLIEPEEISGKKIVVVGGGDSAVESALLLMDENEVTLSYRKEHFARIKPGNKEAIDAAIGAKKLDVLFQSNVKEIREKDLVITQGDKEIILANDLVYIFAGGLLPIDFLQNAGIEMNKEFGKIVRKHG